MLVTGREGQVARALAALDGADIAVGCYGRPGLDVTDRDTVERCVAGFRPDIVVNAAAYTAVDKAESEPRAAFAVNRDGAANVAAAAARAGAAVIQLSTDYVFPGDKAAPYCEADATGPGNIYGLSKLEGEQAAAAANAACVVLRTSWVHAPWGHNFAITMLRLATQHDTVRVVADQHGAPTYAPDIAESILKVAQAALAAPHAHHWRGIFHMTAAGETSWAGFAEALLAELARRGGPSARVEPIATPDYPTAACRPANSRLDNSKFRNTFAHALPDWRDGVRRCAAALAVADGAAA